MITEWVSYPQCIICKAYRDNVLKIIDEDNIHDVIYVCKMCIAWFHDIYENQFVIST